MCWYRYEVRVVAVNGAGEVGSSWVRTTTDQAAPANIGESQSDSQSESQLVNQSCSLSVNQSDRHSISQERWAIGWASVSSCSIDELHSLSICLHYYSESYNQTHKSVYCLSIKNIINIINQTASGHPHTFHSFVSGLFDIEKMSNGLAVILRWNAPTRPNGIVNNYLIYEDGNVNPIYQGLNRVFEYRYMTLLHYFKSTLKFNAKIYI